MKDKEQFDFLTSEANHPFAGWDFSHITITGRMAVAPLTWSYASKLLMPQIIQEQGYIDFHDHNFLIVAEKS
jgi:hypothetical protein